MTSFIVEYSCSSSGTIGHLLKNIHYYNYTEPKVSKLFYRPCFIYPPSISKQISSSGPCSSLTVSLSYPVSTIPTYAAFANETLLTWPPSRVSGSATWCGPLYPICLDMTEHEDVECSLCFLGHLFYSDPKLMQAFLYCALVREFNDLCTTATRVKVWRLELQSVSFANRPGVFRPNLKSLGFYVFHKRN